MNQTGNVVTTFWNVGVCMFVISSFLPKNPPRIHTPYEISRQYKSFHQTWYTIRISKFGDTYCSWLSIDEWVCMHVLFVIRDSLWYLYKCKENSLEKKKNISLKFLQIFCTLNRPIIIQNVWEGNARPTVAQIPLLHVFFFSLFSFFNFLCIVRVKMKLI